MVSADFFFVKRNKIVLTSVSGVAAASIVIFAYLMLLTNVFVIFQLHVFVGIAITVGMVGPAMITIAIERRKKEIDKNLPRVLEDISEGLHAGITLVEAIEETSKRGYGWVSKELKLLVAQMSWGIPIEEALENFSKRVGTEMAKKTTALLVASIRLGGDLRAVFTSTARFLRKLLEANEDRNEQLRPYLSIIYVTLIVFLVTMVMLYNSLSSLYNIQSDIVRVAMTQEDLKILLFDLAVAEAIFGGLIASKLSEGSIYPGLKHSIIMLIINMGAFIYFF
jgi:flagellar protein FlaJ